MKKGYPETISAGFLRLAPSRIIRYPQKNAGISGSIRKVKEEWGAESLI